MKRFFVFLLSLLLICNIFVTNVYADSYNNSAWYFLVQSGEAVVDFSRCVVTYIADGTSIAFQRITSDYALAPVLAAYDSVTGVVGCGMRYFMQLIKEGKTPQEAKSIMSGYIVTENGTTTLTGDGLVFCENYYSDGSLNGTGSSLSNMGYYYRYSVGADYLPASVFSNARGFRYVKKTIKNNPDYMFKVSVNNSYIQLVATSIKAYAGVSASYLGASSASTNIYNEFWNQNFGANSWNMSSPETSSDYTQIYISVSNTGENLGAWTSNVVNGSYDWFDCVNKGDYTDISLLMSDNKYHNDGSGVWFGYSTTFYDTFTISQLYKNNPSLLVNDALYTSDSIAIPVFKSVADMKNGTLGSSTANALPTYSYNGPNMNGVSAQQVQQADEILNNYYDSKNNNNNNNGSGNGGNNNGGNNNGSGSGIWDSLLNAIQGLFELLGTVLSGLISSIGDVISAITGLIGDLTSLANNGFTELLSAFFPFLPSEWFAVIGMSIGLALFIWLVKVFKG